MNVEEYNESPCPYLASFNNYQFVASILSFGPHPLPSVHPLIVSEQTPMSYRHTCKYQYGSLKQIFLMYNQNIVIIAKTNLSDFFQNDQISILYTFYTFPLLPYNL